MRKWRVFYKLLRTSLSLAVVIALCSCSEEKPAGTIQVRLIKPTGARCKYEIADAPLYTLDSIVDLRGQLGQVVVSGENVGNRNEILDQGEGFKPVSTQFARSGSTFSPLDENSLYAASLYYAIEQGYLLFKSLDAGTDVTRLVPDMANTKIVHEARRSFDNQSAEVTDNAEYLPHYPESAPNGPVKNYFFSYPTDEISDMPLGLNLGVMVHEFTHLVSHYLFYEPALRQNLQAGDSAKTMNTLAALDEGLADYFGFLAVKDPGYFDCSYANSGRDISQPRFYTAAMAQALESDSEDFDSHELGAVFASINYEIGSQIGFENNGKSLIGMMRGLAQCAGSGGVVTVDAQTIARCHASASGGSSGLVSQVYSKYLGGR